MKILITGGKGQLGRDLEKLLLSTGKHELTCLGHDALDITKPGNVQQVVLTNRPEVIIHAAANTNVDQCELDKDSAYLVNALGTRNVAVAAAKIGAKLVYISTDYVFGVRSSHLTFVELCGRAIPYTEFDLPDPINVYGKSKLAGEQYAAGLSNQYFIVRTSWLYGRHGKNFVKTMLNLAQEKSEISVVNDQVGSPTWSMDLAYFIEELVQTELYGIYHATNSGFCSWFDLARAIFKLAGLKQIKVMPISTAELNRPAPRPAYSVLENYWIRLEGLSALRPWEEALQVFLTEIQAEIQR
jgi:dTDP-4-dehydrorhamnose reductase